MSSSRRARRRRRHERHGKPSYPSRPKNGLTPTAMTVDEWISPYLFTADYLDGKARETARINRLFEEDKIRKFRSDFIFIDHK